ncbi:unannotated protein [freshwater metagenome]|uniref:Unannotated protein n=1 Tax=freshwater metagenome TaxID=449393 RepID=A0A6J7KZZ3_9ZZZZ
MREVIGEQSIQVLVAVLGRKIALSHERLMP